MSITLELIPKIQRKLKGRLLPYNPDSAIERWEYFDAGIFSDAELLRAESINDWSDTWLIHQYHMTVKHRKKLYDIYVVVDVYEGSCFWCRAVDVKCLGTLNGVLVYESNNAKDFKLLLERIDHSDIQTDKSVSDEWYETRKSQLLKYKRWQF